ncbi:hypothetical protein [Streptococcus sanguinis]|uniref:hypothetical protein n=1 Tax=Streptococcus sanguinis TaxID=1305 RepID=UPI000F67C28C|nr:hypothetical protein [Streptococcus sanguinis]RSI06634.1 hypothetical protein D8889_09280 [Streptococcus sanguinis]RSI20649.1 hypothetical protein D8884_03035 [Streptococcus sanguinis]
MKSFSEDEINELLKEMRELVLRDSFIISSGKERKANDSFMFEYNLNKEEVGTLLLKIRYKDFCECLQRNDITQNHKDYFLFAPVYKLKDLFGDECDVTVYVKFIIEDDANHRALLAVISFHEPDPNKPLSYYFQ